MNPLARKLCNFTHLSDDDQRFLDQVVENPHDVGPRQDLICEGDAPENVQLILEGIACRYKVLRRRTAPDHGLPGAGRLLRPARVHPARHGSQHRHPVGLQGGRHSPPGGAGDDRAPGDRARAVVADARGRGDAARVAGQHRPALGRGAASRTCSASCWCACARWGWLDGGSYDLPFTQEELGETTGLSTVHVNRTLQALRAQDLITLEKKLLVIPDIDRLIAFSGFNPNYLHLADRNGNGAPHPAP